MAWLSTGVSVQGAPGTSVTILGTFGSYSELHAAHPTGSEGDGWIVLGDLWVWSDTENDWVNVGRIKGDDGHSPTIGPNLNWWIDGVDTGILAQGVAPHIESVGGDYYWFIGTTNTGVKAEGKDGTTPHIDAVTGNWFIGDEDTGVSAAIDPSLFVLKQVTRGSSVFSVNNAESSGSISLKAVEGNRDREAILEMDPGTINLYQDTNISGQDRMYNELNIRDGIQPLYYNAWRRDADTSQIHQVQIGVRTTEQSSDEALLVQTGRPDPVNPPNSESHKLAFTFEGKLKIDDVEVGGGSQIHSYDSLGELESDFDNLKVGDMATWPIADNSEPDTEPILHRTEESLASAAWGGAQAIAVVGTKVILGTYSNSSTIAVYDIEEDTLISVSMPGTGHWGVHAIAVVGTKVVLRPDEGNGTVVVVYDTLDNSVTELHFDVAGNWGTDAMMTVGTKVVFGHGGAGYARSVIGVYDSLTNTVKTIGGLTEAHWGYASMATVGTKVVIGRGGTTGTTIAVYDSIDDSVVELGSLTVADWGQLAMAVVGTRVVLGQSYNLTTIAVYDSTLNTISEIGALSPAHWGSNAMVTIGSKVVLGRGSLGTTIAVYDSDLNGVVEMGGGIYTNAAWGSGSMAVVGTKVVLGRNNIGNSIAIYDALMNQVTEFVDGLYSSGVVWGKGAIATVGNQVVLGRSQNGTAGFNIAIYDAELSTITEKALPSTGYWGDNSIAVVGTKVVLGKGEAGSSIAVYDAVDGSVKEYTGLPSAFWGGMGALAVVKNKYVVLGSFTNVTSLLVYDSGAGTPATMRFVNARIKTEESFDQLVSSEWEIVDSD